MRARSGFTLVEILIVVIILGILAAIVIPEFTDASTQARESTLRSNLQAMRSQIELYKIQHNDNPPAFDEFVAQMTETSNIAGATSGSKVRDGTYPLGPYLQQMPANPFNNLATLDNSGTAGDSVGGWEYDETIGAINADDDATHAAW
jgi:general secretion pathway protein G